MAGTSPENLMIDDNTVEYFFKKVANFVNFKILVRVSQFFKNNTRLPESNKKLDLFL
jgi:hypothetical protein